MANVNWDGTEKRYTLAEAKRVICEQRPTGHRIEATMAIRSRFTSVIEEMSYACVDCGTQFIEPPPGWGWCAPSVPVGCVCPHHCYQ